MTKMKMRGLETNDEDKSVVINDSMIKLHENDTRRKYQEQWWEKCQRVLQNV